MIAPSHACSRCCRPDMLVQDLLRGVQGPVCPRARVSGGHVYGEPCRPRGRRTPAPQRHTSPGLIRRAVSAEVAALPASVVVGWVKVNAKPLKQALATWASKWIYLYTHYLQVLPTPGGALLTCRKEATWLGCMPRSSLNRCPIHARPVLFPCLGHDRTSWSAPWASCTPSWRPATARSTGSFSGSRRTATTACRRRRAASLARVCAGACAREGTRISWQPCLAGRLVAMLLDLRGICSSLRR